MKTTNISCGIFLLTLSVFFACKKDATPNAGLEIEKAKVEKLSTGFVQAGDELTIYGNHLVQKGMVTEVFITGRPSEILRSAADSITVKVPLKAQTGKVMVTLSRGERFSSVYGPEITVKPTPLIKGFYPVFAYGGETIELHTENFSDSEKDNSIYLGTQKLQIVSRKGKDTILVKLPADAVTGLFSWQTYNGPTFRMDTLFKVRQTNYPVSTVGQWISNDPGFSYMDTLVRGFPVLAANYEIHKLIFDTALQYINSTDRKYTIFLPGDAGYHRNNTGMVDFVEKIKNTPYRFNSMLAGAIVPRNNMRLNSMQDGDLQKTAYTMKLAFWDYPIEVDDYNYIKIIIEDGIKYAQVWGPYDQSNQRVKILGEHQVGDATIIETEGEVGVVYF